MRLDKCLQQKSKEISMPFKEQIAAGRQRWGFLSFYQKFEHAVILVLTALIAIVVALAVWNLVLKVLLSIMSSGGFDPTDYGAACPGCGAETPRDRVVSGQHSKQRQQVSTLPV
jgi:hypothetical protein